MSSVATPQEIAQAYGRRVGYVYKLASVQRWPRIKFDGRVYYSWADADRTLGSDAPCVSA